MNSDKTPLSTLYSDENMSAVDRLKAYMNNQDKPNIRDNTDSTKFDTESVTDISNSLDIIVSDMKIELSQLNESTIINDQSFDMTDSISENESNLVIDETNESKLVTVETEDGSLITAQVNPSNLPVSKHGIHIKNPNNKTNISNNKYKLSRKNIKTLTILGLLGLCLGGVWFTHSHIMNASAEPQSESISASSSNSSYLSPITYQSTDITLPSEQVVSELAGGYTFTQTKYYPNDSKKSYSDFMITKSSSSDVIDTSDEAKAIEAKLKEHLPVIDDTITVKDASKVTFETYKKDSVFYTILLFDNVPFGYISTDDGVSTSYVTSYYVKSVMKES